MQRINSLNKTKNFSIVTFEESLNLDNYVIENMDIESKYLR